MFQIHIMTDDKWCPWIPAGKFTPREWDSSTSANRALLHHFPVTSRLLPQQVKVVEVNVVAYYISGQDRNEPRALSHTYAVLKDDNAYYPMCGYGWNRSHGERLSIFRGSPDTEGDCKVCRANVLAKRQPVMNGFPHKTKWL